VKEIESTENLMQLVAWINSLTLILLVKITLFIDLFDQNNF